MRGHKGTRHGRKRHLGCGIHGWQPSGAFHSYWGIILIFHTMNKRHPQEQEQSSILKPTTNITTTTREKAPAVPVSNDVKFKTGLLDSGGNGLSTDDDLVVQDQVTWSSTFGVERVENHIYKDCMLILQKKSGRLSFYSNVILSMGGAKRCKIPSSIQLRVTLSYPYVNKLSSSFSSLAT